MAPPPPLLSLRGARLGFGGRPLFDGLDVDLGRGQRACLVGRNGTGKSTLMKVLAGSIQLDSGERFVHPGARIAYLPQDPVIDGATVLDHVVAGLPEDRAHEIHAAQAVLADLGLDPDRSPIGLSGGEQRRAALARALVAAPDVLLMDEPTNHLDLPTILWLEERLKAWRGALMLVSHDRAFLTAVSNHTVWIDRGAALVNPHGFSDFERWSEQVAAEEENALDRLDKTLKAESRWLARGVTARRKRNQGRLKRLHDLRKVKREWLKTPGGAKIEAGNAPTSGRIVIEALGVTKRFGGRTIVADFSTRVMRGDRIGILGPNGAGKSTLLKMLIGQMPPDDGVIRLGTNLEVAYFDQHRETLDPNKTLWETLTGGTGDQVDVRGTYRHVVGYLKDFLFAENQARSPVSSLSGGERNRLLLARLLTRNCNLLVLDEPTNDLDMDTLDVLEEALADYDGTLILVSHDRDFLDRLVTSTIVLEGDGTAIEYAGGYADYLIQRGDRAPAPEKTADKTPDRVAAPRKAGKLSYKDRRELDLLPARIETLKGDIAALESTLADPGLFSRDAAAFSAATARLTGAHADLTAAEERWLDLEMLREEMEGDGV